jgi:hypothetical protein
MIIRNRGKRSLILGGIMVLVAALGIAVAAAPAEASVSKYHGKWPSQVTGCSKNFRIGKTARLKTPKRIDFGWVEWRASRTKKCAGYQWVRFHFTRDVGFVRDEANTKDSEMKYKNAAPYSDELESSWKYNKKVKGNRYLKKGAYNSRIFYAPKEKACAFLSTYAFVGDPDDPNNDLEIVGQGHFDVKPTYCA